MQVQIDKIIQRILLLKSKIVHINRKLIIIQSLFNLTAFSYPLIKILSILIVLKCLISRTSASVFFGIICYIATLYFSGIYFNLYQLLYSVTIQSKKLSLRFWSKYGLTASFPGLLYLPKLSNIIFNFSLSIISS